MPSTRLRRGATGPARRRPPRAGRVSRAGRGSPAGAGRQRGPEVAPERSRPGGRLGPAQRDLIHRPLRTTIREQGQREARHRDRSLVRHRGRGHREDGDALDRLHASRRTRRLSAEGDDAPRLPPASAGARTRVAGVERGRRRVGPRRGWPDRRRGWPGERGRGRRLVGRRDRRTGGTTRGSGSWPQRAGRDREARPPRPSGRPGSPRSGPAREQICRVPPPPPAQAPRAARERAPARGRPRAAPRRPRPRERSRWSARFHRRLRRRRHRGLGRRVRQERLERRGKVSSPLTSTAGPPLMNRSSGI